MRKQQQIWEKEHTDQKTLKGMQPVEPSSFVVNFIKHVNPQKLDGKRVLDIGCGKGRNAIYLAKQGYNVTAIDYSEVAFAFAKAQAKIQKTKVAFLLGEIDKPWPFESNFFDIEIDCFSSIDIETLSGREMYRNEMFRTLTSGGIALVAVVSAEDLLESNMIKNSPGNEKNSSIWPSGKFQKDYDEKELREFYSIFTILKLEKLRKRVEKLGKKYIGTNYWLILQKT